MCKLIYVHKTSTDFSVTFTESTHILIRAKGSYDNTKKIEIPLDTIISRGQDRLRSTSEERPFTIAIYKIIETCRITPLLSPS
jgi:hypothetical protein